MYRLDIGLADRQYSGKMSGNVSNVDLKLKRPCSDSHLEKIANELTDWEVIALRLDLKDSELSDVERDCKDTPHKKLRMLQKWKSKFKQEATYEKLIGALDSDQRKDLAERVREISCTPSGYDHAVDIHNPHISSFIEHLKAFYRQDRYADKVWPIMKQGKYCSLTLVEVQMVEAAVLKKQTRTPIEPKSIFEKDAKRIYIQGAPGSGKTTFLLQMGWMWATGKLFQEFSMVIYIDLKNSQSSKSVVDIFKSCDMDLDEGTVKEIKAVEGKGVLLLFDGWDELPQTLQKKSIFTDLVNSAFSCNFQKCTIVVAARYISRSISQSMQPLHLEVKGFSKSEQKKCIDEIINHNNRHQNNLDTAYLLKEIKARPLLNSCCELPLNLKIIAYVYIVREKLPSTMSETLEYLLLHSILNHLNKTDKEEVQITSIHKLPEEIGQQFYFLCKLAFDGMINDKVLFGEEEVRGAPGGDTLSLLQAIKEYENTVPVTRYTFLHHTLQELLAAIHMSRLPAEHQYEIFLLRFFQPQFETMIQFYAGMTLLKIPEIRSILLNKALIDFNTENNLGFNLASPKMKKLMFEAFKSIFHGHEDYFSDEDFSIKEVLKDDDTFYQTVTQDEQLSKMCSNKPRGREVVLMANCLYEAENRGKDTESQQQILEVYESVDESEVCIENLTLTPSDCLSLGFLVDKANVTEVSLNECQCSPKCIQSLAQGLGCSSKLNTLGLSGFSINEVCLKYLSSWLKNSNLECLRLINCNVGSKGLGYILYALQGQSIKTILIGFSHVKVEKVLAEEDCIGLEPFLNNTPSLRELGFAFTPEFGNIGACDIGKALHNNYILKKLVLCSCGITLDGVKALSDGMMTNCGLEELSLDLNNIYDEGIKYLTESLKYNSTLETLSIGGCGLTIQGVTFLAELLHFNTTIKKIHRTAFGIDEDMLDFQNEKTILLSLDLLTIHVEDVLFKK